MSIGLLSGIGWCCAICIAITALSCTEVKRDWLKHLSAMVGLWLLFWGAILMVLAI